MIPMARVAAVLASALLHRGLPTNDQRWTALVACPVPPRPARDYLSQSIALGFVRRSR
jgi:hypothetical protein